MSNFPIDNHQKNFIEVEHINGYLLPAPDIYVEKRNKPFFNVPEMRKGSTPVDNGNFLLTPEERDELVSKNPRAEKWIRPCLGSREFIRGKKRYCLWLVDCPPDELRKMPLVYERVKAVREFRLNSTRAATRKLADKPTIFAEIRQPTNNYILIPSVSSERRRYIPIGYMDANTIVTDLAFSLPNADLFHFGVLVSSVHMNWVRLVCGRLKSDYRYSATICYNPFPWPLFYSEEQRRRIERSAQKILDARAKYMKITRSEDQKITSKSANAYDLMILSSCDLMNLSSCDLSNGATLADLYDEISMPYDLRRAHEANDLEVMRAYYFAPDMDELTMQIRLLEMYQTLHEEFDEVIED